MPQKKEPPVAKIGSNANVFNDQNYAVWTALAGTAAPTTLPPTNPGSAFYEVGLLTSAGITEAHTVNETKIYDMAGKLIRIARSQEERPFTFSALEGNDVVDTLRFPGSSVTNTGGTAEVQTIAISGAPTGGTFTPSLSGYPNVPAQVYNVTTSALASALSTAWGITVGVTGTAGTSYVCTFPVTAGNVPQMTAANGLTGGTTPTVTVTTGTPGVAGVNSRAVSAGTGRNLRAWAIDLIDGTLHKRIYIPNGEALWTGTTTYSGSAAAEYQFTLQSYPDANGNYYYITDDSTADAESFA
jgi:hypothetical protein